MKVAEWQIKRVLVMFSYKAPPNFLGNLRFGIGHSLTEIWACIMTSLMKYCSFKPQPDPGQSHLVANHLSILGYVPHGRGLNCMHSDCFGGSDRIVPS